ncbi:MAG: hypothetical protein AB9Q22_09675 [Candidatus Reddybacter sp.]
MKATLEDERKAMVDKGFGLVGKPEEIAGVVNFFCSEESSYVTSKPSTLMVVCTYPANTAYPN